MIIPVDRITLSDDTVAALRDAELHAPESRLELVEWALDGKDYREVAYELPDGSEVVEATCARCKNGVSVNYPDPYMRRRDPEAMVIADRMPTDKPRYQDRFGESFTRVRNDTLTWLSEQDQLIVLPFRAGDNERGEATFLIVPANAGFFVLALADLQGFIPASELTDAFVPEAIVYVAPPFRHTAFGGRQVVVHRRGPGLHEMFAYNLYPGPSAKKGVYGMLLAKGEREGWTTLHSSAVRLVTPYDNEFVIMHEGASGGGKSEMTQELHREPDGRIFLSRNTVTGEEMHLDLSDTCELHPVTDDMASALPELQHEGDRLVAEDAEDGWFLRVDHLKNYGTEPSLERLTISPPEPVVFLNVDGKPGATALVWEHTMDAPGKPCPNPRVVMPRRFIPGVVEGAVEVNVRSFGVRTPPCTADNPTYGIVGMLHILPPALAWLWRLVSPRGHGNPSIVGGETLSSEGVGSYWPFATGRMVTHANILLDQMLASPRTQFVLIPNQHIGAHYVGFMGEWIAREYMARRGTLRYRQGLKEPARCPLLGYPAPSVKIDGQQIPRGYLVVHDQIEVGYSGYDQGAQILTDFFRRELKNFYSDELCTRGRRIIEVCMDGGGVADYEAVYAEGE